MSHRQEGIGKIHLLTFAGQLLYLNLLYSSLACQLCLPHPLIAQLLMALLIALAFPQRPLLLYATSWITTNLLMGPAVFCLFGTFYNEINYLRIINSERPTDYQTILLSGLLGGLVCWLISHYRKDPLYYCRILALVLMVNFIPRALQISPTLLENLAHEPAVASYAFDGQVHLRALYLYRQGVEYHAAFARASSEGSREVGTSVFHAPFPLLFWLWSLLPLPALVGVVYWVMIVTMMGFSYATFDRFWATKSQKGDPLKGLLCCSLLGSLYLYPACNYWIMSFDSWAGPVLGAACLFYVLDKTRTAACFVVMASLIRLVCLPVLFSGLLCSLWLRQSKSKIAAWALALSLGLSAYLLHYLYSQHFGFLSLGQLDSRFHGSPQAALEAVRFGTILWAGRDFTCYALLLLCLLGGFKREPARARFFALGALTMLTALSIFGLPDFSQFYGFNFHSLLVIGGVCALPQSPKTDSPNSQHL